MTPILLALILSQYEAHGPRHKPHPAPVLPSSQISVPIVNVPTSVTFLTASSAADALTKSPLDAILPTQPILTNAPAGYTYPITLATPTRTCQPPPRYHRRGPWWRHQHR